MRRINNSNYEVKRISSGYGKSRIFSCIHWITVIFLIILSCSKTEHLDLRHVRNDGLSEVYEASFVYPYSITLNSKSNKLISQKIVASGLELIQNINDSQTVAFQISMPKLTVIANVDTLGNILSMSVWDGREQHLLQWNNGKLQK